MEQVANVGLSIGEYLESTIGQYFGLELIPMILIFIAILIIVLIIRR